MFAFGLGTLANLTATGLLIDSAKPVFGRTTVRFAAAALLVTFASVGIYRALYVPNAVAAGPFCLVP
jgi:sulfite exporter TauE/SafE